jgi:ATP-dependent RNA helicase DOB1
MDRHLDPVIIFSFSKREVEGFATSMNKFDLTSEEEKEKLVEIFNGAMGCLSDEDKNLP